MASEKLLKWCAVYKDGTELLEDRDCYFDKIEKDKIKYFMLKGMDTNFCHDVETGITKIDNNSIIMLINDKIIGKSNDVINYKEKAKMLSGESEIENHIIGYYTGWKESNDLFSNIQVLYWVDMLNGEIKIRLRVTPKEISVINSTFTLIINGESNEVELKCPNVMQKSEFIFEIFKDNDTPK